MQLRGIVIPILLIVAGFVVVAPKALAADPASYTVAGHVLSDEGKPLAGVTVNAYSSDGTSSSSSSATTGKDGAYSFSLAGGKATVNVAYPEWNAYDSQTFVLDASRSDVDFKLKTPPPKTAIIEGRVLDADGKPVSGATVSLGYACCYAYASPAPTPVATDAPASTEPAPATTEPASANGSSSASAPRGIVARPCCYQGGDAPPVTTGDDGAYKFATYAGPRQITATAHGYATTSASVEAADGKTIHQDLTMKKVPPSDAHLVGRVVDAATGKPIVGAQVSWNSLQWGRGNWTQTGADGSYDFWTLPGWGQLNVYANHYEYPTAIATSGVASDAKMTTAGAPDMPVQPDRTYYPFIDTVKVATGENARDIKLDAKPLPTVVLTGYAFDPDAKQGVPGASVNVWNADTGEGGYATTDKTGSFKILVAPGHYTISAYAADHLGGSSSFVAPDDAKALRHDVPLPAGTQTYVGCDDACPVMYEGTGAPSAAPSATTSNAAATDSAAPSGNVRGAAPSPQAGGSSPNTYVGGGGGLPPYSAEGASSPDATAAKSVPGPALGMILVGLAVLALISRRSRN